MRPRPNFLVTAGTILGVLFISLAIMRYIAPSFPAITPYVVIVGLFAILLAPTLVQTFLIRRQIKNNAEEYDE